MLHRTQPALTLIILMALLSLSAFAQNEARIIEVPGAPIIISEYSAEYRDSDRLSNEGVHHTVRLRNSGDQDVVAYGVGFFAFDAFNRFMGSPLTGVEVGTLAATNVQTSRLTWVQRPRAAFTFKTYGIGVAFVRVARLADGTVWHADMGFVLDELRKIEVGLALEDLTFD